MRVLVLCVVLFTLPDAVPSQESPPLPEDKVAACVGSDVARAQVDAIAKLAEDRQKRKQQSAVAGLLLLSIICGAFLFMILVVVIWARRLREGVIVTLPEQQSVDPLWYLKQAGPEADGSESSQGNGD
jgi:hypothetical protein